MSTVPRKFSEKIAIQKQKAAEQEEAFASIMREVASARNTNISPHHGGLSHPSSIMYKGGSLPAFPTPHQEIQTPMNDVMPDLSSTYPGRPLYEDQLYRPRATHLTRPIHKAKHRADASPYHLPQYQSLRESGAWRRTFSDPAIAAGPRGSPSPKVSPGSKEPRSPQPMQKAPDSTPSYGNNIVQDRKTHHMKIMNNSGSLPDVASLSLEIPRSPIEEPIMKNQPSNNNVKFFAPSSLPLRRSLNTGKQVFPRQFSNPDNKDVKDQQQRYLANHVRPDMQGGSLHSPTSPAATVPPPFGSISPLAYEAVFSPSLFPSSSPNSFEQEQYLNLLRMNDLMYDPQQQQQQQQQSERQRQQQQQQQQQQMNMMQGNNMQGKMMPSRQPNINSQLSDDFANQFRMGIIGNQEQRDDISDEILNNIRVGLDPLNFEDYQLLANSNLEVADQNVEEQFRQDRISFP